MALAVISPEIPLVSLPIATETTVGSANTTYTLSKEEFSVYINDPRFNLTFQPPADPSHGRLEPFQVSYADFGFHRDDASNDDSAEQVLLFFGPLMSSRLFHTAKDEMAKRYKVRIVNVERPGIGRTDSVPADKLLKVWRGELSTQTCAFE